VSKLLAGVRAIEFGILFNGDMVGMLLGDLGADVIKVESPDGGDYLREMHGHLAPHWSPTHLQVNKNKRSVTLDVRDERGRDAFWRLLSTADVFVDGLSTGACDRMGIGYVEQRKRNPRIIYCQHSGFGTTGPYASLPTHGVMPAAIAGGKPFEVDDSGRARPARSPDLLGGATQAGEVTIVGSMMAALHIAAALRWRESAGRGLRIDVATSDAALLAAVVGVSIGLNRERLVDLDGMPAIEDGEWQGAKYQYYGTADGKVLLFCCMERKFWNTFCDAIGRDDLAVQHAPLFDYGTDSDDRLRTELEGIIGQRTLDEWMDLAVKYRLPIGPAHRSITETRQDPQLRSRQIFVDAVHPAAGPYSCLGSAAVVEGQPYQVERPAPAHGQHTADVLREIGLTPKQIRALAEDRIA
jgi:crotonobetainyl-CoA:carnitine CoA-transferase CaiB-like acyl-CoA transferase